MNWLLSLISRSHLPRVSTKIDISCRNKDLAGSHSISNTVRLLKEIEFSRCILLPLIINMLLVVNIFIDILSYTFVDFPVLYFSSYTRIRVLHVHLFRVFDKDQLQGEVNSRTDSLFLSLRSHIRKT